MKADGGSDREVDLLIAGAGPAGMAAALIASLEGLDVLLCEKSDQVGGTGSTSAGTLWIPGNSQSRAAGFNDSAEQAETYLTALIGALNPRDLRAAYLRTGPRAIDYLSARSEVRFLPCGPHPDYRSNMAGAAVAGRAIVPEPFDGRLLGADFARIRAPIPEFMVFGGMMVGKADIPRLIGRFQSFANFIYSMKLFARYLVDRLRHPRGTRVMMGNALIGRLFYSLRRRGVPILFDTSIIDVIGGPDGVTGARLNAGGREIRIKTRKGVVLATGGYGHNKKFRETFMPQPVPAHSMSYEGNQGDGVALGERAGAAIRGRQGSSGLWSPVSVTTRADDTKGLFPHLVYDRAKPGLIAVNAAGRRFVNEAVSYHDFVLAMFEAHRTAPSIPAWLICDAAFIKKYGLGVVYPGHRNPEKFVDSGYLVSGNTIEELAPKISVELFAVEQDHRAPQWLCRNRYRRRFWQRRDRAQPLQRRRRPQAESVHRRNSDAAVLRGRGLAGRHRGEYGPCDGRRCPRAGHRRQANLRPLCLRQRYGLGHGGQLSGPRYHAGSCDRVRVPRRDACAAF